MTINISASSLNHSWLSRHPIKKAYQAQGAYLAFIVALALETSGILLSLYFVIRRSGLTNTSGNRGVYLVHGVHLIEGKDIVYRRL